MKTKLDWDYTELAEAYSRRPAYADVGLDELTAYLGLGDDARVLDLGAGVGHLTIGWAQRGFDVVALEPNDRMRELGVPRTAKYERLRWVDALMEDTGLDAGQFDVASYGSSFGVADRDRTLREAARILRDDGWFVASFNHRDLDDPLQRRIEEHIHRALPDFRYGLRRKDLTEVVAGSGLFGDVHKIEAPVDHVVSVDDWIEAWHSHATLKRQAGPRFEAIVRGIGDIVRDGRGPTVTVPYTTRIWVARRRAA